MKKSESSWVHAAIYTLLSDLFFSRPDTLFNSAAGWVCVILAIGFFLAMVWHSFKGESK